MPVWIRVRSWSARRGRAGTGTSRSATARPRCDAACGAGTTQANRRDPPRTAPRCSSSRKPRRSTEQQGRVPARRHPDDPDRRPSARRSWSWSGSRPCSSGTGLFDPSRKRPLPELASTRRGGDQPRWRRAARHHHRGPASDGPAAGMRGGRRAGAGRRGRACDLVRALRAGESDARISSCASSAGAVAAARTWPPSTAKRSAAPSRPCGSPPSPPSGTRPTSPSPISSPTARPDSIGGRRAGGRRTAREVLRARRPLAPASRAAWGIVRRLGAERLARTADRLQAAVEGLAPERQRHRADRLGAAAGRAEPAPHPRPGLLPCRGSPRRRPQRRRLHSRRAVPAPRDRRRDRRPGGVPSEHRPRSLNRAGGDRPEARGRRRGSRCRARLVRGGCRTPACRARAAGRPRR